MLKKIGLFPKDRDSIMISKLPEGYEYIYLVALDSRESEWVKHFLPANKTLFYQIQSQKFIGELGLEEIIENSNLTQIIKENALDFIFVDKASEFLENWSKTNNLRLIVTPHKLRKVFENKIYFDELMKKNNLPKPESKVVKFSPDSSDLPFESKQVLQEALSAGGEGTFFIEKIEEVKKLIQSKELTYNKEYLIRKFIPGKTYGITVFISSNAVVISSIRLQCFSKSIYPNRNIFLGVQWIPTSAISQSLQEKINQAFSDLGKTLHQQKFFGFANFDFMVDTKDNLYILECNARFSSASVQNLKFLETVRGVDIGAIFVAESIKPIPYSQSPQISPYPDTDFAGSTLKINIYPEIKGKPITLKNDYPLGLYAYSQNKLKFLDPDIRNFSMEQSELLFYSDAKSKEIYHKYGEISRVISNYPLFDFEGELNDQGKFALEYFKCY
jgi:biotin carboxylase